MAQLEQYFTATFAVGASDATSHVVTGFPAISVGSSVLITGVYYYFSAAYAANITNLAVNDGTNIVPVFLSASGSLTNNSIPIITSNSQFIMVPGDTLQYVFNNGNAGNLTIYVFYKLIGGQSNPDSLIYGSIKNVATTNVNFVIPSIGNNVAFYKSLIITNNAATTNFALTYSAILFKSVSIPILTSNICIGGPEYLYETNGQVLGVGTLSTDYSYYLSYYYDPLYTP